MQVRMRSPRRDFIVDGPIQVDKLLNQLDVNRESVLVIVDGTLVPGDAQIHDQASVEIRPVISGG